MRHLRFFCTRAPSTLSHSLYWKPITAFASTAPRIRVRVDTNAAITASLSSIQIGKPQQTLASPASLSGIGLHSGDPVTARMLPAAAGEGRHFVVDGVKIAAAIGNAVDSPLCTTLARGGRRVRTVEHLLSAMEGLGVDNCRIEIDGGDEVPILDGSAKEWAEAIEQVGICVARDSSGGSMDKLAPCLRDPKYVYRDESFIIAIPSPYIHITCGINFRQASSIGHQWFSSFIDRSTYSKEIAPSRTFCIYEEIEKMRKAGLIKGGSTKNAIVCSTTAGWLNPPLRFDDEPCRHKVVDLVGDFSLLAQNGNQGCPIAHIIAYKAGHTLHAEFVRLLSNIVNEK